MSYIFLGDASTIIQQYPYLSILATVFYAFAHILPANLIRCYIFRHYFRYSFNKIFVGLLFLISCESLCQVWSGKIFSTHIGFYFHLLYFFYLCAVTKFPWHKQFCLVMPLGLFWHFFIYLAYTIEYYLPVFPIPFFQAGLLLLLTTLISLYPFWLYSEHFAAPLLATNSVPQLWQPLAFLGFATFTLSVLATPFNEDHSLSAFFIRFFASLGGLTSTIIVLYAAREAIGRQQLNSELALIQELQAAETEHYHNLEQLAQKTFFFQENLQAFVQHITLLLEQDAYQDIESYAASFLKKGHSFHASLVCGNELVNALVSHCQFFLQECGVQTSFNISLGKKDLINPLHMTAILGNLLRNATEALSRIPIGQEKNLKLVILPLGGTLVITLDNSFDGQFQQDSENNYLSRKLDFLSQGLGLDSIQSHVDRYGGTFTIHVQEQTFACSIVLPIKTNKRLTT